MSTFNWKKTYLVIGGIWLIIMMTGLLFMALFAQPVADQYAFMANVRDKGVIGNTFDMYTSWSGRFIQALGIGVAYKIFGDFGAQVAVPIIFLILLGAVFSWLIYQIIKFPKHQLGYSCGLGFLVAGGVLYTTACLFDIYLWLDSAFVHLLGMIMIIYDTALYIWLLRNSQHIKDKKIPLTILLLSAFIGQTASEASMILTLGWGAIVLLATCLVKRWQKYRKVSLTMFVVLLLGGLVMILSPGLWNRADAATDSISLVDILINGPMLSYSSILNSITWWKVSIIIVLAIIIGSIISSKMSRNRLPVSIAAGLLCALSLSYLPMVIFCYGTHVTSVENRALGIPTMGLFLGCLIILSVVYAAILNRLKNRKSVIMCSTAIIIVASLLGLRGIISFDKGYISALVSRRDVLEERSVIIQQYQDGIISEITLKDAPVMIADSAASDFTVNGWVAPKWFYDAVLRYYHIPAEALTVKGEKLLAENPQSWYREETRYICTGSNNVIDARYYCGNNVESK